MKNKGKYINYQGDKFWPDHFRDIKVFRFVISCIIDFLKEKMHSGELAILISGVYMLGLNVQLMGIYTSEGFCEPYLTIKYSIPEVFLLESAFAKYVSHFYFLSYIGNLKNSPYFITVLCAMFGFYQFSLTFVDLLFCVTSDVSFVLFNSIFVYAYCKCLVCFVISVHWVFVLICPKHTKYIQIIPYIGLGCKHVFLLLCKFKCLSGIYSIVKQPFEYPLRIKAACLISFGLCFVVNMTVNPNQILISTYQIYYVIDVLYSFKHYINSQTDDFIVIYINTKEPVIIYMKQGESLINLLIYLLEPIYPSLVVAFTLGLTMVTISIISMLYHFKKIILTIKQEGGDSETLKDVWKFSAHSSIFFCSQFVLNSFFLNFIFASSVFIVCYIISFKETYVYFYDYIKGRGYQFWIGLVPVFLGSLYFPRLRNKDNFIRNYYYFSFWDSWYLLIGTIGAFLKAAVRYLTAFGTTILLGYRVHRSIMPVPLQRIDTLYVGFYSTIVVYCLKEGIVPNDVIDKVHKTESLLESINY